MKYVLALLGATALSGAALAQTGPGPPPDPWNYGPSLSLFYNSGGITLGSPTGGQQGIGTINVSGGFFVNGAIVGLTVGSTITGSCTNGFGLYNNAGVLGCTSFAGSGTVTSVGLTVPSYETVAGSPVTAAGTLAVSLATQTTNKVFAAPNGSTGVPTFRALAAADIPTIPATGISGQLAVANGGTGLATLTANAPLIGAGTSNVAFGTRSGSTTTFATTTGTLTSGHCVQFDASSNLIDAGGACTTGGGGGTVTSASINQLAWYNAAGTTVVGLATANNGLLITSGAGVPSISSTIPAATQANITGTGTLASGTTASGFTVAAASMPALTGDVTTSAGAVATTIAANAVTYAKFQTVAGSSLVGNSSGSTGNAAAIGIGATLAFSGTNLQTVALSGDITTSANSFATTLATVNANTGSFGSSTAIPILTFDGKGRTTAASTAAVIAPAGTLSGSTLNSSVTASSLTSFGILSTLGLSGALTSTQAIGVNSTDGLALVDSTAATVGAQKWSPRVHWTGQGWKTNATAGSQTVDVIEELQPVQGAAAPTGNLVWSGQVNNAGYVPLMTLSTSAGLTVVNGFTATGLVTNADLVNASTTVNGTVCTLGSSCTETPAAGTLTGTTLASGVTASSLTSLGTIAGLTVTGSLTATGLITNADLANSGTTVNGVLCTLGSTCSITPAAGSTANSQPTNNPSNASTSFIMAGFAGSITPTRSGKILFIISGSSYNSTASDGCDIALNYGTGSAPAAGVANTGTTISGVTFTANGTTTSYAPYTVQGVATGLTLSTAYWFDITFSRGGGASTCQLNPGGSTASVTAVEL